MDLAAVGRGQPGDHAQSRRLARAVGAEQRVELARPDGEIEAVHGGLVEALGEPADLESEARLGRKGRACGQASREWFRA